MTAIRTLAERGVGKKTIAREVGAAGNTVRRYLRQPVRAGVQTRPTARRLTDEHRRTARELYEGPAAGKAGRPLASPGPPLQEVSHDRLL